MATTRERDASAGAAPPPKRGKRKRRQAPGWVIGIVRTIQVLVIIVLALGLGLILGATYLLKHMPSSITELENYKPFGRTIIYSSDGTILANLFQQNRQVITIDKVPQDLQNATIAIEDSRFYQNDGIDFRGIGRAIWKDTNGSDHTAQGGSTITQQLVRNLGIGGVDTKKTLLRKVREGLLALKINQQYTKQQILEMYLNQVYYGSGSYGVQAAAGVYFGKSVDKLDLAQCAMIAGLPRSPHYYSPYNDKDAAKRRRDVVLARMAELGYITQSQKRQSQDEPVRLAFPKAPQGGSRTYHAPYFVDYVTEQVSRRYGSDMLYRGGLRVYTTLNWPMQQLAEQCIKDGIANARSYGATQGALVAMDPKTGYVKAMVGGTDYAKSQFNIAADGRRQPGSSFKPIIYTAAMDMGLINENSILQDNPVTFPGVAGPWSPKDDDGRYRGEVTATEAVAMSINIPAVHVLERVQPSRAIQYAQVMGVKSPLAPYLTLALGASAVTPLEMATVYSVIDNLGQKPTPLAITRIEDSQGNAIEDNPGGLETLKISKSAFVQMSDMLRAVVTDGTAAAAFRDDNPPDAHAKTGTTQDHKDVWLDGYTAKMVCIVWAGHPSKDAHGRNIYGLPMHEGAWGATISAPIWKRFMIGALAIQAKEEAREHPKPKPVAVPAATPAAQTDASATDAGVTTRQVSDRPRRSERASHAEADNGDVSADGQSVSVWIDDTTGLRAHANASGAHQETFPRGTEPTEYAPTPSASEIAPADATTTRANPDTTDSTPAPAPTVHAAAPPPVAPPSAPRMVTVSVCIESGKRATEWCPETIDREFPANAVPGYCRIHKPPPGEH